MKFKINEKIFNSYPDLNIGVVIAHGVDNSTLCDSINIEFDRVVKSIKRKNFGELADYPVICAWRDVYKSFGEKKSRSSVEALMRRIINNNSIPSINPLVDIYNLVSLKYELPCGGEDLNALGNDMHLTYAIGDEKFLPLGSSEIEKPNHGEIIYKFDDVVICRNFNYRESDITKLTENSKDVILVIEDILGNKDNLNSALFELVDLVSKYLGGTCSSVVLDKNNKEMIVL